MLLTIDGKVVKATKGMTVLQAAKEAGIQIPTAVISPIHRVSHLLSVK